MAVDAARPRKGLLPRFLGGQRRGSALAGEDAVTAARREVLEETGLQIRDLRPIYRERGEGYLFAYFAAVTDEDPAAVTLQPGETVGYRWVDDDTLRQLIAGDETCMHARMLRAAGILGPSRTRLL